MSAVAVGAQKGVTHRISVEVTVRLDLLADTIAELLPT